jgi:integrase
LTELKEPQQAAIKLALKRQYKYVYSVSAEDVADFIKKNECIRGFLNQYEVDSVTYGEKAVGLCRFFRWLQVARDINVSPLQFLNLHLQKKTSMDVEERRWALKLALDHSRDNSDLKGKAQNYKYGSFFLPVKMFCDALEAPLTTREGLFKKRGKRKYQDALYTVDFVKKILGLMSQRNRTVSLVQLQSGQAIKQVLVDINGEAKRVFREIDYGAQRIRFDFPERKGNNFAYFSFISRDAIQEIRKWRPIREAILGKLGIDSPYLFITEKGKPLTRKHYHTEQRLMYIRKGVYKGPLSIRGQCLRKFFEQEASPPERGISKAYITFMLGHSSGKDLSGNQTNHPLDVLGGTYDPAAKVYPNAVEKEYQKLEPHLNIYSEPQLCLNDANSIVGLSHEDIENVKEIAKNAGMYREIRDLLKANKLVHIDDPTLLKRLKDEGKIR